jgi:hypothetical protein
MYFETHGVPCAIVISSAFVPAARVQAAALGAPDYPTVVVPHPVQPLTREELHRLADDIFDEVVCRVTSAGGDL